MSTTEKLSIDIVRNKTVQWRPKLAQSGNVGAWPVAVQLAAFELWSPYRTGVAESENPIIECVTGGRFLHEAGGKVLEAKAGDVVLIEPGTSTTVRAASPFGACKRVLVVSTAAPAGDLSAFLKPSPEGLTVFSGVRVRAFLRSLSRCRKAEEPTASIEAASLVYQLLLTLRTSVTNTKDDRLSAAIARIGTEGEWPSVDELASLSGVSVAQFSRLFRARMGISPGRYVQDQRLQRAADYLLTSEQSINQIAARLGYQNANYLTMQFRNRHGVTPTQYRRGLSDTS